MSFNHFLKKAKKSHFTRYGLPFIVFITGGSFVLKQFASVRYEVSRHNKQLGVTPELLEEAGFKLTTKTLEEEFDETVKKVDIDNWKNIRGPRPWEEPTQDYLDMIERRAIEMKKR